MKKKEIKVTVSYGTKDRAVSLILDAKAKIDKAKNCKDLNGKNEFIIITSKLLKLTQAELFIYKQEYNKRFESEHELLGIINNLCDSIIKYNNAVIKNTFQMQAL